MQIFQQLLSLEWRVWLCRESERFSRSFASVCLVCTVLQMDSEQNIYYYYFSIVSCKILMHENSCILFVWHIDKYYVFFLFSLTRITSIRKNFFI